MAKRKQTPITKSAKGEQCQLRIPGVCDGSDTVFCHLNGGGTGTKHSDIHGSYGCQACHRWVDGGYAYDKGSSRDTRDLYHLQAIIRTQSILLEKGLIHE